jgi:hypothetical protein
MTRWREEVTGDPGDTVYVVFGLFMRLCLLDDWFEWICPEVE